MGRRESKRRSLRRAVGLECAVACETWGGPVSLPASDVSYEGVWIDTAYPLEPGEEVVLSFAPPGAQPHEDVWAIAEVARVGVWRSPYRELPAGMGLTFTYVSALDQRFLIESLVGRPPRLPGRRLPPRRALPPPLPKRAVKLALTDVEFLDDPTPRAVVVAPCVRVGEDDALDFTVLALSELLTAPTPGMWLEQRIA